MPRDYQQTGTHTDNTSLANKTTDVIIKTPRAEKTVSLKNGGEWIQKNPQGHPIVAIVHPYFLKLTAKESNRHAYLEMLGGEWLRLQNPIQPKVRIRNIAEHGQKPQIKVLSKKLKDFMPFRELLKQMQGRYSEQMAALHTWDDALRGVIPGLGKGLFSAITILNGDLHEGNIGITTNAQGAREIVVIDTGQAYLSLLSTYANGMDITAADIKKFPFINSDEFITENMTTFFAYVSDRKKIQAPMTLWNIGVNGGMVADRQQQISPAFVDEKYGSILCELLSSDAFVENFMSQYATTEHAMTVSVKDLKNLSKKCAALHNRRKHNLYEESFKI